MGHHSTKEADVWRTVVGQTDFLSRVLLIIYAVTVVCQTLKINIRSRQLMELVYFSIKMLIVMGIKTKL